MSTNAMEDLTSTDKSKPRKHPRSYDATLELTNEDNVGNRVGLTKSKKRKSLSARAEAKIFPFARLPGEIRNMIYRFALTRPYPIVLRPSKTKYRHVIRHRRDSKDSRKLRNGLPYETRALVPHLLLLNKSIHAEAGPILYSNDLLFENPKVLWQFLSVLTPTTKTWIETIRLDSICDPTPTEPFAFPAFRALIGTTNLKQLLLGYPYTAIWFHREAYEWLETVLRQKKDKAAVAGLVSLYRVNKYGDPFMDPQEVCDIESKIFRRDLEDLLA